MKQTNPPRLGLPSLSFSFSKPAFHPRQIAGVENVFFRQPTFARGVDASGNMLQPFGLMRIGIDCAYQSFFRRLGP